MPTKENTACGEGNTWNRPCEAAKDLLMMLRIREHFTLHIECKSKKKREMERVCDREKKGGETGRERQKERGRLVGTKEMGKMVERRGRWKERWEVARESFSILDRAEKQKTDE